MPVVGLAVMAGGIAAAAIACADDAAPNGVVDASDGASIDGSVVGQDGAIDLDGTTARPDGTLPGEEDAGPCPGQTLCDGVCVQTRSDLRHCGACQRPCAATPPSTAECIVGECVVTLASNAIGGARSLAVDGTYVYWSSASDIARVPVGGGTSTVIVAGQSQPRFLRVDAAHLYWAVSGANPVMRSELDGGAPFKVTQFGAGEVFDLAVDGTYAYYTSGSSFVTRVPLTGATAGTQIARGGTNLAGRLAIDSANVYFSEYGSSVYRAPIDGGATSQLALSPGIPQSGLAVAAGHVYWGTNSFIVYAPASGATNATTLVEMPLYGVVTDGTSLYGHTPGGSIVKVPLDGRRPETLSYRNTTNAYSIGDIAVDATSVYWTETVSNVGRVMKVTPK